MIQLIRKLNQMPLPLTIENRYVPLSGEKIEHKSDLATGELWDHLREKHPNFHLPTDRAAWLKMCESATDKDGLDGRQEQRAADIVQLLKKGKFETLFSVGVGSAALEYLIKKQHPDIQLICTDSAPKNVKTLQQVFYECDQIYEFNLFDTDWEISGQPDKRLVLLNRLDSLFSNDQWRRIFRSMHSARIVHVLFISSYILNLKGIYNIQKRLYRLKLLRKPTVFIGWLRTLNVYQRFWQGLYEHEILRLGGLTSFLLKSI